MYQEWWDDSGRLLSVTGASIPAGYRLDNTYPGRAWICPIRSCRSVYKDRQGLGYHFTTIHRATDLNDNGDGTFSIIGPNHRNALRVVSSRPLDPNEPPMPEPYLPVEPTSRRAANALHAHLRSRTSRALPFPSTPELSLLFSQPKQRDLTYTTPAAYFSLPQVLGAKQVAGLAIHVVGDPNPTPCSECRLHADDGPLRGCVSLSAEMGKAVFGFLGASARACANCLVRRTSHACSVRRLHAVMKGLGTGRDGGAAASKVAEGAEGEMGRTRRSAKGVVVNTDDDDDDQ
ncbi:hypothetical protein VTI74DRAFT_1082 [Chaetomium olivicolor]